MRSASVPSRRAWPSAAARLRSSAATSRLKACAGARSSRKRTSRPTERGPPTEQIGHTGPDRTMDNYSLIELKIESGIALLAFNRPDKRNAMSDDLRTEFIHALESV